MEGTQLCSRAESSARGIVGSELCSVKTLSWGKASRQKASQDFVCLFVFWYDWALKLGKVEGRLSLTFLSLKKFFFLI